MKTQFIDLLGRDNIYDFQGPWK